MEQQSEQRPEMARSKLGGVGTRLLASFALLALLPLAAGTLGWRTTSAIHEPLNQLVSVTQTFGAHDRAFRNDARRLANRFVVKANFETREAFEASQAAMQEYLYGMRGNLTALSANEHIEAGPSLLLLQQEIEHALQQTLATTDRRLNMEVQKDEHVDAVVASGQRIADLTSLLSASLDGAADGLHRRRLDALRYGAVTLAMMARESDSRREYLALSRMRKEFAAELRSALNELAKLPEQEFRVELGQAFEEIFASSIETDGLFDTLDSILVLRSQEEDERQAIRVMVFRIVDLLGDIAAGNDAQINTMLLAANGALRTADYTLLGIGAISSIVALLVMLVFVRGNVLRRLGRLNDATKRLTEGELDTPVPVEGSDELGQLSMALEAFRCNALALRKSESELKARTEELEYVNKELDQFAYVASHDLKAPMRAIDSLAGFLREDLGDKVDAESGRHLDMMQGRIKRLEALLDSLLEYSRAGRVQAQCEAVDLRALVECAVEIVNPGDARVALTGEFGRVSTWKTPLEQVIRNLVDNAFKHNDDANGIVSISCDVIGNRVHLAIADNGPGIAPEFHERIFGMFQTLRPRDEVEGSGMGLAILKKLVDTYDGTIAVASNPDERRGTTFTITWPVDAVLRPRAISTQDAAAVPLAAIA